MVQLSILDLSLIAEGDSVRQTLDNTVRLAQRAEQLGYQRFWVGEHHFINAASSSPAVLLGQIAAKTQKILLGSGALQSGPFAASHIVEQFGTLAEFYPGRIELGLGRSNDRVRSANKFIELFDSSSPIPELPELVLEEIHGVPFPQSRKTYRSLRSYQAAVSSLAIFPPGAEGGKFFDQVQEILELISGERYYSHEVKLLCRPGGGTDLPVWLMGSSAGESALVAGSLGLPFVASYHFDASQVLPAIAAYRSAFEPGIVNKPTVMVSADVLAADTFAEAQWLARSSKPWLVSIRSGSEVIAIPHPDHSRELLPWEENLIADRVASRFIGTGKEVVEQLRSLAEVTGAEDIIVTSVIHDRNAREHSFELIAQAWKS